MGPPTKTRMSKVLRFWLDCLVDHVRANDPASTRAQRVARVVTEFEEAGDAMRYLDRSGQIARGATPRMRARNSWNLLQFTNISYSAFDRKIKNLDIVNM
jgi:hypothetical protein